METLVLSPESVGDSWFRYNVMRQYEGQDFMAENAIVRRTQTCCTPLSAEDADALGVRMWQVNTLEGIRTYVNDGSGNALDLLKDERHVRSTLGIRMLPHGSPHRSQNINPREVRICNSCSGSCWISQFCFASMLGKDLSHGFSSGSRSHTGRASVPLGQGQGWR